MDISGYSLEEIKIFLKISDQPVSTSFFTSSLIGPTFLISAFSLINDSLNKAGHAAQSQQQISSSQYMASMRCWLSECIAKHPSCRPGVARYRPTRLLDIGSSVAWEQELELKEWIELLDPLVKTLLYIIKFIENLVQNLK